MRIRSSTPGPPRAHSRRRIRLDGARPSGLSCAAMNIAALERSLQRGSAAKVLTDARLLRRVIRRHRHLSGVGLQVPHARCYAVSRDALLSIVEPDELGVAREICPPR